MNTVFEHSKTNILNSLISKGAELYNQKKYVDSLGYYAGVTKIFNAIQRFKSGEELINLNLSIAELTSAAAYCLLYNNNNKESLELFHSALSIIENNSSSNTKPTHVHANAYYDLACAYALDKNISSTFEWLEKALTYGDDKLIQHFKTDEDFISIYGNAQFEEILMKYCK